MCKTSIDHGLLIQRLTVILELLQVVNVNESLKLFRYLKRLQSTLDSLSFIVLLSLYLHVGKELGEEVSINWNKQEQNRSEINAEVESVWKRNCQRSISVWS